MSKVSMYRCDTCETVAEEMNEGVIRLTDNVNEIRLSICDDCTEASYGELPLKPRRGRVAQAEAVEA